MGAKALTCCKEPPEAPSDYVKMVREMHFKSYSAEKSKRPKTKIFQKDIENMTREEMR